MLPSDAAKVLPSCCHSTAKVLHGAAKALERPSYICCAAIHRLACNSGKEAPCEEYCCCFWPKHVEFTPDVLPLGTARGSHSIVSAYKRGSGEGVTGPKCRLVCSAESCRRPWLQHEVRRESGCLPWVPAVGACPGVDDAAGATGCGCSTRRSCAVGLTAVSAGVPYLEY